jgi:hypothetical protein
MNNFLKAIFLTKLWDYKRYNTISIKDIPGKVKMSMAPTTIPVIMP